MFKSTEGVYRKGKIELVEIPTDVPEETRVIVTFLNEPRAIDLRARGIGEVQAADLRARLATFAPEWGTREMDVYDDYDAAKGRL